MKLDSNVIMQVSVVVKDIETKVKATANLFGMDEPEIFTLEKLGDTYSEYKGIKTDTMVKLAVFKMGEIDFEFIEPDDNPSVWKTFLEEKGEGICQVGLVVKDKDGAMETLKENGLEIAFWGSYPGGTYHIVDTREFLGMFLNVKHLQ